MSSLPSLKLVTCWCEGTIGRVSVDDIRAGRTFSCGLWWCQADSAHLRLLRHLSRRAA